MPRILTALRYQKKSNDSMADLNGDIRLTVDTGKVALGYREVNRQVSRNAAKAVVIAVNGKKVIIDDLIHNCNVAQIKIIKFTGNSLELGALCGKPYSVNAMAVLDAGNSGILKEDY